jgi:hypothetical protein
MCAMGFSSYLQISEEGTQLGTESSSWGADSGLFRSGLYFNSESMVPANEQKFLTEIGRSTVQDRGVKRFRQMGLKAEGSLDFVVYPEGGGDKGGIGLFLKHAFGNVSTGTYSGAGTYLHTFTPHDDLFGNLAGGTGIAAGTGRVFGITMHIGREDDAGTIRDYPFLGNRIKSIKFSCAAGEEMMATIDSVARKAATNGSAILSVSFPTMAPFLWKDATLQFGVNEAGAGGTERTTVEKFEVTMDNNLKEVWVLGTNVLGRVVPNGQRTVTGSFSVPYESWVRTEYEKWISGTSSSLNVAFVSSPYRLEFRMPKIFYTGNAPSISTMEETVIDMPFSCTVHTNFDLRVFLVNLDPCVGFCIN